MKKTGFFWVVLGIALMCSGCTVVHSHAVGHAHRSVTITTPAYGVHRHVRHRHHRVVVPHCEPPRRHHRHHW